ncbi:MAG: patatin-like phospholipase family protein [Bosea sp.]|jgi:NTE family protein|nr:patatin-like phospholipase family protein [Bosea sp. (in: a-proteobacteria)]
MSASPKSILLALQGGGAHGAFTWGVLDQLIEDGRLRFEAISGTSAGAMNAVVLADGWIEGGPDGARKGLDTFWRSISTDGKLSLAQRTILDSFFSSAPLSGLGIGEFWLGFFKHSSSPYNFNPLNFNPLKDLLEREINFERVRSCKEFKLFIAATNVETGKARVFEGKELTADHVMASACLPTVFQAVEIDGVPYWDGGYMGNPALYPLFYGTGSDDILLVQINPLERKGVPKTAQDIRNRLNEISFNATLLREMRAIDFVTRLIEKGLLSTREYKKIRMHRIALSEALSDVDASSKLKAKLDFFLMLKKAGRVAARNWLSKHYDDLGRRATIDLKAEFG